MKYIMFEIEDSGAKVAVPIIFPKTLVHRLMAQSVIKCLRSHCNIDTKITVRSAGDVKFSGVVCNGGSETLNNIKAKPDDANIIESHDYTYGVLSDLVEEALKKIFDQY